MKQLWEILVPTVKRRPQGKKKFYSTAYHRLWDKAVRQITGGLTIHSATKGQWVSPNGEIAIERMLPVRIFCTESEISSIADMTAKHYDQLAVMYYLVTDNVVIKHYPENSRE